MRIIDRIKRRIKHTFCVFYVLYADSTELMKKAQKVLQPLPQGCELVKLTYENKSLYTSKHNVDRILQVDGDAWAIINDNNELVAFQFGTYRGKTSLFFKVKNCDYEHIEIMVDKEYRRKGLAVYLLYNAVKNMDFEDVKNKKVGTVIRPYNIPSLKLHKLIGFNISHKVLFIHLIRKKEGRYSYINIPQYSI